MFYNVDCLVDVEAEISIEDEQLIELSTSIQECDDRMIELWDSLENKVGSFSGLDIFQHDFLTSKGQVKLFNEFYFSGTSCI